MWTETCMNTKADQYSCRPKLKMVLKRYKYRFPLSLITRPIPLPSLHPASITVLNIALVKPQTGPAVPEITNPYLERYVFVRDNESEINGINEKGKTENTPGQNKRGIPKVHGVTTATELSRKQGRAGER